MSDTALKVLLVALGAFDLVLGGGALAAPELYGLVMHPGHEGPLHLLPRTAAIWLVFAAVELGAAARPSPDAVLAVAVLRLMDVPADLVYLATGPGLGAFGMEALIVAPMVNLAVGLSLLRESRRRRGGVGHGA